MANLRDFTPAELEQEERDWADWLQDRPQVIKDLGARFRPWKLYRMQSTGHRVFPMSFMEDGTLTVAVTGEYNFLSMERQVFGIEPDDLVECDLPHPGEPVGVYLNEAEQLVLINEKRREHGLPPLSEEERDALASSEAMTPEGNCVLDGKKSDA